MATIRRIGEGFTEEDGEGEADMEEAEEEGE